MSTKGQFRAVEHQKATKDFGRPSLWRCRGRIERIARHLAASQWIKEDVDRLLDRPRRLFDHTH